MRIAWILGWAVPAPWFAPLAREALPGAGQAFFDAGPDAMAAVEAAGPFDWIAGYSLGTLLLLLDAARAARLGRVALLAPIFAFPREAGLGGRIARAQLRQLGRRLRQDPAAALGDFYARAGLDIRVTEFGLAGGDTRPACPRTGRRPVPTSSDHVSSVNSTGILSRLQWGLERLENARVEPPLPAGWRGWCGTDDPLLDAARLRELAPSIAPVPGAGHHPGALFRAFAAEAGQPSRAIP